MQSQKVQLVRIRRARERVLGNAVTVSEGAALVGFDVLGRGVLGMITVSDGAALVSSTMGSGDAWQRRHSLRRCSTSSTC
jgi:hypothetical protein